MTPSILIAINPKQREEVFGGESLRKLESFAEVTYHEQSGDMTQDELSKAISDFDGLITCWGSPKVTPEVVKRAKRLKIISHSAGSIRPFICQEAFERGICVTNAASAIAVSVAETTLGLIICSLRHLFEHNEYLRRGKPGHPDFGPTHELTGSIVGVIGMGHVGRHVIGLLKPFACRILVYDPHRTRDEIVAAGARPTSLEDIMSRSDVVSLHAPNIPKNHHMISRDLLGRLRDGALLVNTARGELIDEESLISEAHSGRIRLALDVFESDAHDVARRLEGIPNVILTPHIAGRSIEARRRQGETVVEDLRLFFAGEKPRNLVTSEMMEWMA